MQKRWTKTPADPALVAQLQAELGLAPLFCELLVQRGITDKAAAVRFFRPSLDHLHDPFLMCDMDRAAHRLISAILRREPILLYGDYDVDGTTSVALMHSFLKNLDADLDHYLPDRETEGYGLSNAGLDYARANGRSLVIAMDVGIKAVERVSYARKMGLDVIICDHHKPGDHLPAAYAVLDPQRRDCNYPYKGLSGCGVAFKLAQAVAQLMDLDAEEHLHPLLDYLVISIAADIVPMTGENRTLAHFGLQQLNATERPGLRALLAYTKRALPLSISDVVFGIAPTINAAGRLDHARRAVEVLIAEEPTQAQRTLNLLSDRNNKRKLFDRRTVEEATAQLVDADDLDTRRSLVLYDKNWHKGVIGIAASRMVERFYKPTVMLTASQGKIVGSARSVRGFNVYNSIRDCEEHLLNYGGHAAAAGMTLLPENLDAFRAAFEESVARRITPEQLVPEVRVDAVVTIDQLDLKFWKVLQRFAPFGPENRAPVLCLKNCYDTGESRLVKHEHLRLSIRQENVEGTFSGMAFFLGDHLERVQRGDRFHLAIKLEFDTWKGRERLRFIASDIRFRK